MIMQMLSIFAVINCILESEILARIRAIILVTTPLSKIPS